MAGFKRLGAAVAVALAAPAAAITPEQAQTLPLDELARIVLGEAGANVVEVDRPTWPVCGPMCPPEVVSPPDRTPPLHLGLVFYERPYAASSALETWTGLCGTTTIRVGYDRDGRPTGIGTGQRWGVPHGMKRVEPATPAPDFATRLAAATAECREGANLRSFFIADNDVSALRVAIATHLLAEAARAPARPSFKLDCETYMGPCRGREALEQAAAAIRPDRINMVNQVDCARPDDMILSFGPGGCYHLSLASPGESALIEIADAYSALKLKRVEYRLSQIVY